MKAMTGSLLLADGATVRAAFSNLALAAVRKGSTDRLTARHGSARFRSWTIVAVAVCACAGVVTEARAITVAPHPLHVTDGMFTDFPASNSEWDETRPSVHVQDFAFNPVNGTGGAELYVEGGISLQQPTLWLLYDAYALHSANFQSDSFFDIFFQTKEPPLPDIPGSGGSTTDYLIRVLQGGAFEAFEKPDDGLAAPLDGQGNFIVDSNSPWTPVNTSELNDFHASLSFGFSPDHNASTGDPDPHLIVEFDVTTRTPFIAPTPGDPGQPGSPGAYDPAPAFWGAGKGGEHDPPMTSEIFQLNPDGSVLRADPVFDANGDPAKQPQDVATVPEPAGVLLLGIGALGALGARVRRQRRTA